MGELIICLLSFHHVQYNNTHDTLLQMQEASEKESAINSKRFIIQTVLSVASLIVAAIAAVASIISLL